MRYILLTILFYSTIILFSCGPKKFCAPAEHLADTTWLHDPVPNDWTNPSETFAGTANGVRIAFQHNNYTSYRLITGVDTVVGNLNTERGFQDDEDATLYILYYDYPDSVLWHFVRMTDGSILMLDKERNVLPDTHFKKEE